MPLRLAPHADLLVYYEADMARYYRRGLSARDLMTLDAFYRRYRYCPSVGFELDGRQIGGVIFDGTSAHIAVIEAYHGRWATLFRPALAWLLSVKAEIEVSVDATNTRCVAFIERSGWQCIARSATHVRYLIKETSRAQRR